MTTDVLLRRQLFLKQRITLCSQRHVRGARKAYMVWFML
jgi:hypothetical protein